MTNNVLSEDNQYYELSYELLYLLRWMIEHESDTLKEIITKAIERGFMSSPQNESVEQIVGQELQYSIVNFLDMLDVLVHECLDEHMIKKAHQINLIPSLHKIDANVCDKNTLQGSIDKTMHQGQNADALTAKQILFKEILRRWKPGSKKKLIN